MGRHATVEGRMASSAAARAKVFTKIARELAVAAKAGGDPANNSRLRIAMERAREQNMPKDNIDRVIKKATGEAGGNNYEEITYEGYGPGGSALLVEVLTDNRNRTNPEIRRIFEKAGGNMAEMGAVAWMFKHKGVFDFEEAAVSEDALMTVALEAGAEDVVNEDGILTVYTSVADFAAVREVLHKAQLQAKQSGLEQIPETTIKLSGDAAKSALDLLQKLEEHDDVQNVYHNFDISREDVMSMGSR